MARIKATDSTGKVHWLREIRNGTTFAWDDEIHASEMPRAIAMNWKAEISRRNLYLDWVDRMEVEITENSQ